MALAGADGGARGDHSSDPSARLAKIRGVIALHALWSGDSELCIWGEQSSVPVNSGDRRVRLRDGRRHPFACGAATLIDAVERLGAGARVERWNRRRLTLRLPSSERGPQASPQLLRVVEDGDVGTAGTLSLEAWAVDAIAMPPGAAVDLLLSIPTKPPAGLALGESLHYLAEACKLALELVARGRLRPALERQADRWAALWRPVLDEPADAVRAQLLVRSMPPVLRSELGPWEDGYRPDGVLDSFIAATVDACAREFLGGQLEAIDGTGQRIGGAVDAWLLALVNDDPLVDGDPWELARLAERVEDWWEAGCSYAAQRMFRTCFRLVPPGGNDAEARPVDEVFDAGDIAGVDRDAADNRDARHPALPSATVQPPDPDTWCVEFLLQHKEDPSVLVPAADVWARSERLEALGRMLENPQERLLGGLGHALRLWPDLAPALDEPAPTKVELTAEQAFRFLREAVPLLEQAGFAVITPPWWRQRLQVKLSAQPDKPWEEASGLFGVDGLCAYEWKVALGDTTLTLAELEALAELKVPLVQARGRWIALRADDVEMALRFFKGRRTKGRASAGELLRDALVAGNGGHGTEPLPDVEIEAEGWLADLLSGAGDRRLRDISTPATFNGELRPYQQRGLAWLCFLSQLGLGACLADDMGLGKTAQTLALLLAEREPTAPGVGRRKKPGPTLLICPVSVSDNWWREAERFAPSLAVHMHYGTGRLRGMAFRRQAMRSDMVVTTYALALRDRETLQEVQWARIVLDEAQNIKTRESRQTRAIRGLNARHRVALTGTPVENRLAELHSIIDFLNPGLLGSVAGFRERFATPIERWRDGAAAKRLRSATAPFILRRLKTDREIISDLPEKIEMRVDCHLTKEQATLYQAVVDEMLERLDQQAEGIERSGIVLQTLMKLKQVCNHPAHLLKDRSPLDGRSGKLARLEEIVEEALAEGDKALCFTQFAEFGHLLRAHLQERLGREVLFLHGGTPKTGRDQMVQRFQLPDGPPLFVLSLKAGGTGLNLTAANHVIHYDRWWNPAVEDQASDRAFRIGQHKNVQVRKLTCVGTLEERIDQLIADKKDLAEQIVGSGEAWLTELDTAELRELVALSGDAVVA
jgi:SNF2-related domain/SNF2 Helicase protein/Helicase conserved C-terminal domain